MTIFPKGQFIPHARYRHPRKCLKNGAPGEIRTPDRLVRRLVLEPAQHPESTVDLPYSLGNSFAEFRAKRADFTEFRPFLFPSASTTAATSQRG